MTMVPHTKHQHKRLTQHIHLHTALHTTQHRASENTCFEAHIGKWLSKPATRPWEGPFPDHPFSQNSPRSHSLFGWSVFFVRSGPAQNHISDIFEKRNNTFPSQGLPRAGGAFGNMACRRGLGQKSDWNMTNSWPQNPLQETGFPTMGYGVCLGSHMVANLLGFTHLTQNTNFSWYCMQICISLLGGASDTIFLQRYDIVCPTHGVLG